MAIRTWCLESQAAVHRQLSPWPLQPAGWDQDRFVESVIESAAFQKLVALRNIDRAEIPRHLIDAESELSIGSEPLIESCPFDRETPVDLLAELHEFQVSRRQRTATSRQAVPRKKGGVFYTPQPVVDYILQQVLLPRLNDASHEQVEQLTLLDPSAGSGAFLISAYRILLDWYRRRLLEHEPSLHPAQILQTDDGWKLTRLKCRSILERHLFGVDVDPTAALVTRRLLWLTMRDMSTADLSPGSSNSNSTDLLGPDELVSNIASGHALVGASFGETALDQYSNGETTPFHWHEVFPRISARSGFDLIVGNPPYRRERHFKRELDEIAGTPLGRFRSARMDLWYYFVHRGIELLREGGTLSFITNAYWLNGTGAEKLMATLRDEVQVDELLLLHDQVVFPSVSGRHMIFRVTKSRILRDVVIKSAPAGNKVSLETLFSDRSPLQVFTKPSHLLFRNNQLDVRPDATEFLAQLRSFTRLADFGQIRQGIAENPAVVNRRTIERFPEAAEANHWRTGEGVFTLTAEEVSQLYLSAEERTLLRPYHTLSDLTRYWQAKESSRFLIYSTRETCTNIDRYPALRKHLERFRAILESRRETVAGTNRWWHLHWPRDEQIWRASKLVIPQMAERPSLCVSNGPVYVSFSNNVFVPSSETREDLRYLCGILNSKILWVWFQHHAKSRGIGLELNGHTLQQAPVPKIDFANPAEANRHDELVQLVDRRMDLERNRRGLPGAMANEFEQETGQIEAQIDQHVESLFRLSIRLPFPA